jgi:hypothetical protein
MSGRVIRTHVAASGTAYELRRRADGILTVTIGEVSVAEGVLGGDFEAVANRADAELLQAVAYPALDVTCPSCGAQPGHPCTLMTQFGYTPLSQVHLSREFAHNDRAAAERNTQ